MEKKKIKIGILGAGISGLSIAYQLVKNENFDVKVFEKNSEPGGSMTTKQIGDFLVDFGPNSGLETTPLIREMVEAIGLGEEMVYANEAANKRYILRNNSLRKLPTSPIDFMFSRLFSIEGKLRLFAEPFIPRFNGNYDESIYDFVVRRLGYEFADYAIDPFVSGVYAGDPGALCVKSAFPKVKALEDKYGGLIKGMILGAKERKKRKETSKNYAKMFTFLNGMQSFPKALTKYLGDRVVLNFDIQRIGRGDNDGYSIEGFDLYRDYKEHEFDILISTLPAYKLTEIIPDLDKDIISILRRIYYPRVKVMMAVFKKEHIGRPLDGFGFLIPGREKKKFLGAIWSSTIFPNRAPEGYASFTIFMGGARAPKDSLFSDEEIKKMALAEFKEIMKIKESFVFLQEMTWEKAIPQYNLGYPDIENKFQDFEKKFPGVLLAGNYRGGISVGDCVKNSQTVLERVNKLVEETELLKTE